MAAFGVGSIWGSIWSTGNRRLQRRADSPSAGAAGPIGGAAGTGAATGGPAGAAGYRTDIDGLRALAVLPILLFHLGTPVFSGGYVGVDIFFVISGFLIGGMTCRQVRDGTFSLAIFYQRRVRRIVPALIATLLGTFALGAIVLLPTELAELARSAAVGVASGANIYFWLTIDYFSTAGHENPLLHLWSLGVEEQFYILFPLLAMAAFAARRVPVWPLIATLCLGSFMLSVWLTARAPQASFYLLPTRAWELLAGVMVAITPLPMLRPRALREIAAAGGLLLLGYAIFSFDAYTPFPGWRALIPCAGAAAIIAAGGHGPTLTGRLLSTGPLRFVGLISYSLYLWHWPVIVIMLAALPAPALSPTMQAVAGLLSFALAILSWRYVETPFRGSRASPRRTFAVGGLAAAAVLLLAGALLLSGGWAGRFSPAVQRTAAALDYPQWRTLRAGRCFLIDDAQRFDRRYCLDVRAGTPSVLLVGDSHAAHLWPGLNAVFTGSSILQATASGCRPSIVQSGYVSERCRRLMDWIFASYLPAHPPRLLILAGFWKPEDLPDLRATLARMKTLRQRTMLVGPAPSWTMRVPKLLAIGQVRGDPALAEAFVRPDRAVLDTRMAAIAAEAGVPYVSLVRERCTPRCRYFGARGDPLVVDDAHMSAEGSALAVARFRDPALIR